MSDHAVPPSAKRVGDTNGLADPYAWMLGKADPDFTTYVGAENEFCDEWFRRREELVDSIVSESLARGFGGRQWPHIVRGDWEYASEYREPDHHQVILRRLHNDDARWQTVLDLGIEGAGRPIFHLGAFEVDPTQQMVAWAADAIGNEIYTVKIRRMDTISDLPMQIDSVSGAGLAWLSDDRFLLYVSPDERGRPSKLMRSEIGRPQVESAIVFEETDEKFTLSVRRMRNGMGVFVESSSLDTSESRIVFDADPLTLSAPLIPRREGHRYRAEHWDDRFAILTNHEAPDGQVVWTPLDDANEWHELVPHQPGRRLDQLEAFARHLIVHHWSDAQPGVVLVDRTMGEVKPTILDEPHDVELGANENWSTTMLQLRAQSFTRPPRTIELSLLDGATLSDVSEFEPACDLTQYRAERIWVAAMDGSEIPVDLVRHVSVDLDGSAPCCVFVYGAYGAPSAPWFSIPRLSLLDRGVVWALAHPRGGGELGSDWYLQGRQLKKMNTFTDTIDVCEHLGSAGIVDADRIALRGGSAGGTTVGACMNLRPDLLRAAVAEVPFVDVLASMSDPTQPQTSTEWDEWGDPRSDEVADYMARYSPYENVVAAEYPNVLVTAAWNDQRVRCEGPVRWFAKLRHSSAGEPTMLLSTDVGAGHFGRSGEAAVIEHEARIIAFIVEHLGGVDR